jgi:homoserine/homoserine lactone efflux protein
VQSETILAYTVFAAVAIVSPGPAVVLALRNGASFGARSALWSSLGNVTGIAIVSSAAMLGLGAVLMSSALLFGIVKVLGAAYLFYLGLRHLFGRASAVALPDGNAAQTAAHRPFALYREGALIALTNPKAILFFTALFPPFLDTQAPLLPQFLVLTGTFMALSFFSLLAYALLAGRAQRYLIKPLVAKIVNRVVGAVFVTFGVFLLATRRHA